jgi:hypothetical protein
MTKPRKDTDVFVRDRRQPDAAGARRLPLRFVTHANRVEAMRSSVPFAARMLAIAQ